MGAAAPGPALQRVPLDEVDEAGGAGAPPRSAAQHARRVVGAWSLWHERSPSRAVVLLVAVIALLVGAAVATPAAVAAYERSTVLRPAAFDGAIRYAGAEPAARWTAPVDVAVRPLLVGDTVVVATGQGARRDQLLTGLDVVSGSVRWTVPLGSRRAADEVRCARVDERVACTVGSVAVGGRVVTRSGAGEGDPPPDAHLLLVDADSGAVLHRGSTPGAIVSVAATAALRGDVVLASVADDVLTIRRVDPATGVLRWEARRPSAFPAAPTSQVRLTVGGGLVVATAEGTTLVVRASDGSVVPSPADAAGTDETFLRSDGTLVRTRYRLQVVGVDVVSELSTGTGEPWLTVRGVPVEPAASDGTSGLVFTSSTLAGGPMAGRVRAYEPGRSTALWHALTPSWEIAADVGGRVVLRAAGALVGLDATTGETVWRRTFGLGMGEVFSDGRHVVVQRTTPDAGVVLMSLDLDDGSTGWEAALPEDTQDVLRLGAHLYVVTDDELVALR